MTRQRIIIAILLAGAGAWPIPAGAEPGSSEAVRIEVDVSALPKGDRYTEDTRRWVLRNQTAVLERAGFVVSDDATKAVRIEVSRYGEYGVHTRAKLMVVGDAGSVREFVCEACMDSQFLQKVDEETTSLVERLRVQPTAEAEPQPEAEPEPEPGPAVKPANGTGDGRGELATSDEAADYEGKRVGVAGYVGIGALTLGAGLTIGGVIVAVDEPTVRLLPDDKHVYEKTDRRPTGIALTVAGASLLVGGAVLVAIDQTVLRKRRDRRRAHAAIVPQLSPANVGVAVAGRF